MELHKPTEEENKAYQIYLKQKRETEQYKVMFYLLLILVIIFSILLTRWRNSLPDFCIYGNYTKEEAKELNEAEPDCVPDPMWGGCI